MPRLARVVVPGMPHHVTQRGNRRQQTFFNDQDYSAYLELMVEWCKKEGVEIWGYCLMPNHTHLIAVPAAERSLRRAIGEAHRRYTRRINFREKVARVSLARAVRVVRHGRTLLAGGRAVRGIEPGAGATGGASGRVALEQCAGTLVGARRLFGEGRPLAGDGWRLECFAQQRPSSRGVGGIAWARPNRPSARGRVVLGSLGGSCWPRPEAAERRPAKKSVKLVLCPPIVRYSKVPKV